MEVVVIWGLYSPYRLLVMMNTTGVFQTAAMLSASWNVPMLVAPSPKKVSAPNGRFWSLNASAAPTAMGKPCTHDGVGTDVAQRGVDEVHRAADALGATGGAAHELREPGLGLHAQGERLAVAAIGVGLDITLGMAAMAPTETASWPWHRWVVPWMRPPMNSSWTFSSNSRMFHIWWYQPTRRSAPAAVSVIVRLPLPG